MDDLVSLGETLQQASAALVGDDLPEEVKAGPFLQVVVIGSSGAGKSAVLNSLIGDIVLPTAEGGATRFPVLIDLLRDPNVRGIRGNLGARTNMASAAEIRKAIQADMQRWVPKSSHSREEAHLILKSATAPSLRILDLPGLEARASDLDGLIQDNASNNDAILLVVLPATNLKESLRILRVANDIDREGVRTIGIVTKLDRAAADKSAVKGVVELLTGQGPSMAQDYPWVAMLGQPVAGKDSAKEGSTIPDVEAVWKTEGSTLGSVLRAAGHKGLDASLGREALIRVLARTVRKKMKEKVPRIMAGLETRSQDVESELLRLGDSLLSSLDGSRAVALELCRGFDMKFCENLDGSEGGGSQMVEKFVSALPQQLRQLPLDNLFNLENVRNVVMEADGYQPYLLSPEKGLRLLIRRSLELAKQPGLQCVDEVHKILLDIISASGNLAPSLIRFPNMKRELVSIASSALDDYRAEAKRMVTSLVDMERVFVPPAHFIEAEARRQETFWKEMEAMKKGLTDRGVLPRRGGGGDDEKQQGRFSAAMSTFRRKEPPPPPPQANAPLQELAGFLWKVSSKGGWSKRWFALSDKTARLYYVKKPDEKTPRGVIPLEDCVIEDVVAVEELPTSGSDPLKGQSAQSLAFKITNKVPYKTVVKVHHNLILRAESQAEKTQWVSRMRMLTKAGKDQQPAAAEGKGEDTADSSESESDASKSGAEDAVPPPPGAAGQGVPPPSLRKAADPEEELKYMTGEVRRYVEAVLSHLADNIPKAIVLTQVERAKDAMLTKLYQSVSALSDPNISSLLEEDAESKGKRDRFQKQREALQKLKRMLSLHDARASSEEANDVHGAGGKDSAPKEDWRLAFQQADTIPEDIPSPQESPKLPSKASAAASQNGTASRKSSSAAPAPTPSSARSSAPSGGSAQVPRASSVAAPASGSSGASATPNPLTSSMSMGLPRNASPLRQASPMRMMGSATVAGPISSDAPPSMGPPMGGRRPSRLPPPPPAGVAPGYKY